MSFLHFLHAVHYRISVHDLVRELLYRIIILLLLRKGVEEKQRKFLVNFFML